MCSSARQRAALSRLALALATAGILVVTLWPSDDPNELHLLPLREISAALTPPLHPSQVAGVVGNVLLFVPFGAALRACGVRSLTAISCGLLLSAAIETAQVFVPGRTTATDDVLLNTLGTVVGYTAAAAALRLRVRRR